MVVFILSRLQRVVIGILLLAYQQVAQAGFDDLLDCSSRIIRNRTGGFETLQSLATMVESALRRQNPDENSGDLATCWLHEKSLKQAKPESLTRYLHQISLLDASDVTKRLFTGFADPKSECTVVGTYWGADMCLVGTGFSVNLASCHNSLGDTWLEAWPGAEITFGPGLGHYVGISAGKIANVDYSDLPIAIIPTAALSIGSLVGVRQQFGGDSSSLLGADIDYGMRMTAAAGCQVRLRLFSLGKDYDAIKNQLFGHE